MPVRTESDRPEYEDVMLDEAAVAHVRFARSEREAGCQQTDTLLQVAKGMGLHIPSGCQFGVCGTCKVKKLAGEVHMVHNGGITDEEVDEGFVLACCSNPLGEVVIDY